MRSNKAKYKHIIWDWNGTLFDDAHLCVEILNTMMAKRGLSAITLENYREHFGFPVMDYYVQLGFDFEQEDFDDVANEYILLYNSMRCECSLRENALQVLDAVEKVGLKQSILSAYHQELLEQVVEYFDITVFFTNICGLGDYYANCKIDLGKKLIETTGLGASDILLVGDTAHDFEVARQIGCDCVLLTDGHQSKERLETCGVPVLDSILEVKNIWS